MTHPLRDRYAALVADTRATVRALARRWRSLRAAATATGLDERRIKRAMRGDARLLAMLDVIDALAAVEVAPLPSRSDPATPEARAALRAEIARVGLCRDVDAALGRSTGYTSCAVRTGSAQRVQILMDVVRAMPDAPPAGAPPTYPPPASDELIAAAAAAVARAGGGKAVSLAMGRSRTYVAAAFRDRSTRSLEAVLAQAQAMPLPTPTPTPTPPPPPPPPPPPAPKPKAAPKPRKIPRPQRPYITRLADAAAGPRCTVWWGDQVLYRDPSGDVVEPAPGAPSRVSAPHGEARYLHGRWTGDPLICERIKKIVVG